MTKPSSPSGSETEGRRRRVARPGWVLVVMLLTWGAVAYAIYALIAAMRM